VGARFTVTMNVEVLIRDEGNLRLLVLKRGRAMKAASGTERPNSHSKFIGTGAREGVGQVWIIARKKKLRTKTLKIQYKRASYEVVVKKNDHKDTYQSGDNHV